MQLLFNSTTLNQPTAETLREYGTRRFEQLKRYLPTWNQEFAVRITVHKERFTYVVCVELTLPTRLVIKARNEDLRAAIDAAYVMLKNNMLRKKERRAYH